ncbi:MAG: phosphatidate cytidylyltransferase [Rhodospirillales bacterium]|nr:phosphatidate cytidylyltransferase [Rhodospirillales bacterium]MCB9973137.1 phosphatidate cytidylyltransferase [Rhodospirillales bacterium]
MTLTKLQKRILSALVLIPLVVGIVYSGGLYFSLFLLAALLISIMEWVQMSRKTTYPILLTILGLLYLGVSFWSFAMLRDLSEIGLSLTFLAYFCVWASDSTAYLFGKLLGGPKLAPKISPNKTIAGLVGAAVGPSLVLVLSHYALIYSGFSSLDATVWQLLLLGAVLGVVGQAGDLLISALKRVAKVKDTGNLIPGHGGLLDRIDSLLLISPVFFSIVTYFFIPA